MSFSLEVAPKAPQEAINVIIVMGVAGCGKTTLAKALAQQLDWVFIEAANYHSPTSINKIKAGQALNDADYLPWLHSLVGLMRKGLEADLNIVMACSALKSSHRDILNHHKGKLFVYIEGDYLLISKRLKARSGHFIGERLLKAQFALLEPLDPPHKHLKVRAELSTQDQVAYILEHPSLAKIRK